MRFSFLSFLIGAFLLFGLGCEQAQNQAPLQSSQDQTWKAITKQQMTPETQAQLERSMVAIRDLGSSLLKEISEGLDAEGPAGGIQICREKAPEIATEVADRYQLKIGRTSAKLRNPKNKAPQWAQDAIKGEGQEPLFFEGPKGELGVLAPIRLKSQCLMCHGAMEDIDASVQAALTKYYPEDHATGFAEGDLRGWFWAEVPPAAP